ncbi:N-acetylglucosamine kinase [Cohnella soli]|uniref:N-acetylglucosamine kinase n=1 Tax=Cohnella soli TaxID=425005 RepID=A0ABW0HL36_9BACL
MTRTHIIGVDGGNSKTDYFLFDIEGRFVDRIRAGTCSHERFADGYASSYRVMDDNVRLLLERNRLSIRDIAAGAFGLAGADLPSQKEQLCQVVERLGFTNYALDNDSFLGIKAGSEKGFGICSINGSGTVAGGISPSGRRLQIGGVGSEIAGDEAGGYFYARKVLRTVYDSFYRMGQATRMAEPVMELLGVPDKASFIDYAVNGVLQRTLPNTELMRILFAAADDGDAAAVELIDASALQLARTTAGCMHNLDFGEEVDIILAGSVWIKAESPLLFDRYRQHVSELTGHGRRCRFIKLQVPPATGAVLWALELALGRPVEPDIRQKVITGVESSLA